MSAVPDHVALTDHERTLTYAELDAESELLAAAIAQDGAFGEPIVLLTDHSVDTVIGMLAAVRAGRPFTVIDPATPADRMFQVVDDVLRARLSPTWRIARWPSS